MYSAESLQMCFLGVIGQKWKMKTVDAVKKFEYLKICSSYFDTISSNVEFYNQNQCSELQANNKGSWVNLGNSEMKLTAVCVMFYLIYLQLWK